MFRRTTRRAFTASGFGAAAFALVRGRAPAAQFEYKYHHDATLESPIHVRSVQLWEEVEKRTAGRLQVKVFPNSMLGTGPAIVTQIRAGAVQFGSIGSNSITELVPVAGIMNVGFAFRSLPAFFAANDGALGDVVRREVDAKGLMIVAKRTFETGLRQLTSSAKPVTNAGDLAGLKMRVAPGRITVDLFKTLGANPTPVALAEVYTALQTKLVDGTDLPYSLIEDGHMYEVQRYLSISNHSWGGYWMFGNPAAWTALPSDIQDIVTQAVTKYEELERHDIIVREPILIDKLRRQGMQVNTAETTSFRAKLGPYYARWKSEFGPTLWALLEKYSGGKLG